MHFSMVNHGESLLLCTNHNRFVKTSDFNGNHHRTNALENVISSEDVIRSFIMKENQS